MKKSGVEWPSWNFDKDSIKQENMYQLWKLMRMIGLEISLHLIILLQSGIFMFRCIKDVALGYYNDSERTEKSFIINPNYKGYPERMYRTGDYGRIREDGLLEFHGRMDRQVKHMGHRVELDEIEYAANQIAGVDECVSLYNKEKEVLYLFYSGETAMRQVVLELRKVLPGFMVPRKVKQVSALPKLASGKIDMTTLKEEM